MPSSPKKVQFARKLRKEMGVSERALWVYLRMNRLGFRFRRQHPIGPYILDFYCPEAKLCLEVDGEHHETRQEQDAARDSFLEAKGIETIRMPSLDLFNDRAERIEHWIKEIHRTCESRTGRKTEIDLL